MPRLRLAPPRLAAALIALVGVACQRADAPVLAPETHGWKEEGELVVAGLEEVERLFKAGNRDAARVLAERVYTDRWEPRLEQAARKMDGPAAVAETEYAFSVLLLELEGNGRDIEAKIHALEEKSRAVAEAASRAFPPPEAAGLPAAPPPSGEGSKPIVPDVKPNWEQTTDVDGG